MTFTTEQLRKFAELGGWAHVVISRRDQYSEIGYSGFRPEQAVSDGQLHAVPDFTRDTNLAACFEVLEQFCQSRGLYYGLLGGVASGQDCYITKPGFGIFENKPFRTVESGKTKQEAIIAAVLKADEPLAPKG